MGKMIQLLMEEKCHGLVQRQAKIRERNVNGPDNYWNAWKFTLDYLAADTIDENFQEGNPFLVPHIPEESQIGPFGVQNFGPLASQRPATVNADYRFR